MGLTLLQYSLRNTPRSEAGLTPFFCVYGREARLPSRRFHGRQLLHASSI